MKNITAQTIERRNSWIAKAAERKQKATGNRHTTRTQSRSKAEQAAPANPQALIIQALASALPQSPLLASLLKANGGSPVTSPAAALAPNSITVDLGTVEFVSVGEAKRSHKAKYNATLEDDNFTYYLSAYKK